MQLTFYDPFNHLLPAKWLFWITIMASSLLAFSCGYKTPPEPIKFESKVIANVNNSLKNPTFKSYYIGDYLIIPLGEQDANWQKIEVFRNYLPEICDPCFFKEELLAVIYKNQPTKYLAKQPDDYWLDDNLISSHNGAWLGLNKLNINNFPYLMIKYKNIDNRYVTKLVDVPPKPKFLAPLINVIALNQDSDKEFSLHIKWDTAKTPKQNHFNITPHDFTIIPNHINLLIFKSTDPFIYMTIRASLGQAFIKHPNQIAKGGFYAQFVDNYGNKSLASKFFP
ncbi:MAG: hypothetical protein JJV97_04575 [SAR324 cluster bacterium]|nr:hypothetical protein [SAR324 cluster bacterium]